MTDITKQLAEALRHIENAATDLRFQRYEIRAAATEALAAHEAEQAVPAVPDEWTRRMLLQAATAIEMGPRASLVMNVEGVVDNLRRIAAAPAPEAQDSARTSPAHQPVHGWTDADADAARLALELECILTDRDTPMPLTSRWWESAHEALALHRKRLAEEQAALRELECPPDPETVDRALAQARRMERLTDGQLSALLKEARKIIRASSSRSLAKDWDRRATQALAGATTGEQHG